VSSSFASTTCRGTPALYRPRRPERTLLHRLVGEHLETYLSLARQGHAEIDPVPGYVEGAFRKYLECGIPSYGFARARCNACGYDFFVAFSCQLRGICPSCNTRRMAETAAHLTDHAARSQMSPIASGCSRCRNGYATCFVTRGRRWGRCSASSCEPSRRRYGAGVPAHRPRLASVRWHLCTTLGLP
jgi:hypothetical protein